MGKKHNKCSCVIDRDTENKKLEAQVEKENQSHSQDAIVMRNVGFTLMLIVAGGTLSI